MECWNSRIRGKVKGGQFKANSVESHSKMNRKLNWAFSSILAGQDLGRMPLDSDRRDVPSLVHGGRSAGKTRVEYRAHNLKRHLVVRDFFITMIQLQTRTIFFLVCAIYLISFFFWSIPYYLIIRFYPDCIYGATSYVEAWTFSFVTQTTIGYGNTGPERCWAASWVIVMQCIFNILLEAVTLGIIFSRISHPAQRGRSIFISTTACMARRDGILKFMFRVADIRKTQVIQPQVRAFLYTWGDGRTTAEGESIPVRCEELDIGYIDGMLILPLIIEHTVDERSPLCGHTLDSLTALSAEVLVTFEGTTEFGNTFMARRSYLPQDIHWGYQFKPIIAKPSSQNPKYCVELDSFHDVQLQACMPPLPPSNLSHLVVNRAKRTVPYPLLGENTLVLSDCLCIAPDRKGQMCLCFRAADTYPNQMLEITVCMYLYRWFRPGSDEDPSLPPFTQEVLKCGSCKGADRLYLRIPVEVVHEITDDSPIASWRRPEGLVQDKDCELVVVMSSYLHQNGQNRMRQRTYIAGRHVRYGHRFKPIVEHPSRSRDKRPRVTWNHFHDVVPVPGLDSADVDALQAEGSEAILPPESHRARVTQHEMGKMRVLQRLGKISRGKDFSDAGLPGNGPAPLAPAPSMAELDAQLSLDCMTAPADLSRYASKMDDEH